MNKNGYGTVNGEKRRNKRRKITAIIVILVILLAGLYVLGLFTSDSPEYQMRQSAIEENHILKEQVSELEDEVKRLKKELEEKTDYIDTLPTPDTADEDETVATPTASVEPTSPSTPRE